MLKKMQRRFVLVALSAFFAVMLLVVAGINLLNYHQTRQSQEQTLSGILEYEQISMELPPEQQRPINEMEWVENPDGEFTTHFFIVRCDDTGAVSVFGSEYITSIDEAAADAYTKAVLQAGKETGTYGDYRYRIAEDNGELIIAFLNIADSTRFCWNLLIASLLIMLGSLLLVALLIVLLSGAAISPFVHNMELQKRFITDAGHELKTPITSISTSADILEMTEPENEWITNIQKQSQRLARLVTDLVTLSRMDEEIPFPEKARFSLSEAAWETGEAVRIRAEADRKRYQQEIEDGLFMFGDRAAISRLLSILLDNAVRYTPAGGEIRLSVGCMARRIVIEVSNTCTLDRSIDPERLFERFYRPDESRSVHTGGSGIGLAIAREITEGHGGRICAVFSGNDTIVFKAAFSSSQAK